MPKKSKLNNLQQIDGKEYKENEKGEYEITSLDQLFGDRGFSKYQTLKLEEYETQLEDMNSAELRRHAVEVAHIVPGTSTDRLKKRLILEFKKHVSAFQIPKQTHKKEKPASKEVLKIMSEVK